MTTFKTCITVFTGLILMTACAGSEEDSGLITEGAEPVQISSGHQFTEGPYWHSDGYLLFSDIPANRIYRWVPGEESEVFMEPSGNSNGIQADNDGHILLAQHAGRVVRLTADGEEEVLADQYEGNRLNSPNDLTVHSNNTIYFTDPPYGVDEEDRELDFSGVYRLSPDGDIELIYDEFERPNGIVLSPDETRLYVNDTQTGRITVFDVDADGNVSNSRPFASVGPSDQGGGADGMVVDLDGRLYSTGPSGLSIFDSQGNHLEDFSFGQPITNLEWGGESSSTLYVTSRDLVFSLSLDVTGYKPR